MSAARDVWRVASQLHVMLGPDLAAEAVRELATEEPTKRKAAFWLTVAALLDLWK